MLDSLPPGSQPATDVVTCKVFIDGTVLSNEILLMQVTVNKTFNKVASAKVVFRDGSPSDRDFELSNDDKFKPGNELKIQLGYHGEVDTVFEGIVVKHGIKVRQHGSVLMIEAKDKAIKLTTGRKSAYFIQKTDSDAITELAGELETEIEATPLTHSQLVKYDSTDWDFIVIRAEANGMLVLTDDGKLVIKKPATSEEPVMVAAYGDNILEFEAEMDARRQVAEVTGKSWDYTQQQDEASDSGTADFEENGNISSDDLAAVLNANITLNHSGHLTQSQLQNWADAYALRNHLAKIVGRVRVEGKAAVKPGTMITLEGVGDRFNGNVFVTGVLHHYEGSWISDIQFGWQDDWFYKKEDVMNKPAAGLRPGVNGLQIGIVKDVDDTEGGGQYRIKVHIPAFTGDEGIWARIATLDAGANRGSYFRPEVGDEVVVGFLSDDPNEPVALGYLHSKDSKQSPIPEQSGALESGFVTKEGIKLIFDDTNKRMTLLVPTASGEKSIILNTDASALEIKDENQNTIKMEAQGITIQSNGIVTIKGSQVLIN